MCHLPYMANVTPEEEFKVIHYSFVMSRRRGYFTPLLYMANIVPHDTTGHGHGGGVN